MTKRFTFEQAAAAIEKADHAGLPAMLDNVRRYLAARPDELARLEGLVDARTKPAPRAGRRGSASRPGAVASARTDIGRSDVLAAIAQYRKDPKAFLDHGKARDPKWVYLVDEADSQEVHFPLKAIGLYLLRFEAHECTTNDVERLIDFERLGFKVVRTLKRKTTQEDGA